MFCITVNKVIIHGEEHVKEIDSAMAIAIRLSTRIWSIIKHM